MGAYELRYIVEDVSLQKSVSLRDQVAEFLREQGVTITLQSQAAVTTHYQVTYVDLESEECQTTIVEATDPEAAKDEVRSKTRAIVTEARPV